MTEPANCSCGAKSKLDTFEPFRGPNAGKLEVFVRSACGRIGPFTVAEPGLLTNEVCERALTDWLNVAAEPCPTSLAEAERT